MWLVRELLRLIERIALGILVALGLAIVQAPLRARTATSGTASRSRA
jgi:hypothetical protein